MSIEKATEHLKKFGFEGKIRILEQSSATVALAAEALGCAPERIAKTLSFRVGEAPILVVCAGDTKIDNAKFKACFATKAKMLTPDEAENEIGHAVGGVCPFGICDGVKIYLDESLKRFETVFPACGSGNSAVELTIAELETAAVGSEWVDVCKLA